MEFVCIEVDNEIVMDREYAWHDYRQVSPKIPVMHELDGKSFCEERSDRLGKRWYFGIKRIMDGDQYLLWEKNRLRW